METIVQAIPLIHDDSALAVVVIGGRSWEGSTLVLFISTELLKEGHGISWWCGVNVLVVRL